MRKDIQAERQTDRQTDRQAGIEDRLPDSLHLEDTLVERGELKLIPHLRLVSEGPRGSRTPETLQHEEGAWWGFWADREIAG